MNNFGYIISKSFVSVNIKIKFRNFAQKERRFIMYNIQTVSERIKLDARQQGIKLKEMLESCGLNVNFISQMSDRIEGI